jgi:hypothetical protein
MCVSLLRWALGIGVLILQVIRGDGRILGLRPFTNIGRLSYCFGHCAVLLQRERI